MKGQYANSPQARHLHACLAWICQGRYLSRHSRQAEGCAASLPWLAALVLLSLLLGGRVHAQTPVTGTLEADARWSTAYSPYRITGDLVIRNGASLTIDPGVVIYMAAGANVRVESGAIQAAGRADQPIQVLSDKARLGQTPGAGDWGQWQFNAGTVRTRLEWVQFQHGSGLAVRGSAPVLNQLSFKSHQGAAISVDLQASPSGVGLSAVDCGVNGIAVEAGDVTGTLSWGLRGIPYVVMGSLSVGQSPAVSAVNPSTVDQGQSGSLVLTGARLQGMRAVESSVPGVQLTPVAGGSASAQTLNFKIAADAAQGPVALRMLVDAGELFVPNAFQVSLPVPRISELQPSFLTALGGSTLLKLKGRNFSAASQVLINGTDVSTSYLADVGQLQVTVPEQGAAGTLSVQVRNPAVGGGAPLLSDVAFLPVNGPVALTLALAPNPIALPPDRVARVIEVRLSRKDSADRAVALSLADPGLASLSTATVTIPAGQTSASFSLTPQAVGITALRLSSAGLPAINVPVVVSTDHAGVGMVFSSQVGVRVAPLPSAGETMTVTAGAQLVTVNVGPTLASLSPRGMTVGTQQTFTLQGQAIPADAQLSLLPSAGVTVDQVVAAPDGRSLSFRLTADSSAALGLRRVVVRQASGQPYVFAQASQGSILLTAGLPRLDAVSPQSLVVGGKTRVQIRGANLQGVSLALDRTAGVALDAQPAISAQGDLIELDVVVDAAAELGRRRIRASNAGGSSTGNAELGNSFYVVATGSVLVTPVASPTVRVKVASPEVPVLQQLGPTTAPVVVLNGAGVLGMTPNSGVPGEQPILIVRGQGLSAVTQLLMQPAAGLTLGAMTVSEDGTELRLPLTIAADAAQGPRKLVLKRADGQPLAAIRADVLRFLVSKPGPTAAAVPVSPARASAFAKAQGPAQAATGKD